MTYIKTILLIMLLKLSHFFLPFIPFHPHTPPSSILLLSSCSWVVHITSVASAFPIIFLASPCLFCTYIYASYSLYLFPILPTAPPHWYPSMWSTFLWFYSCSSCLLGWFLCFLGSVVDSCCHFTVHIFGHLFFLR